MNAALLRVAVDDSGAAIVEYAIITAGISVVAISALQLLGVSINALFAGAAANWTAAALSGQ
jgi:Flp pilus assembly pilin Flp